MSTDRIVNELARLRERDKRVRMVILDYFEAKRALREIEKPGPHAPWRSAGYNHPAVLRVRQATATLQDLAKAAPQPAQVPAQAPTGPGGGLWCPSCNQYQYELNGECGCPPF